MTAKKKTLAFTLIELLITIPLSVFLITAIVRTYIACGRMMDSQRIRNNLSGSVRVSTDYITRDISLTGYGLRQVNDGDLPDWINWKSGITNPCIINYGSSTNTPDAITLVGAFDRAAELRAATLVGASTLTVPTNQTSAFNATNKCLIYIGRAELAKITSIAGNTLSITTDPSGSEGLAYAYPVGTPIELIQVITYSVTNSGNRSYLIRKDEAVPSVYYGSFIPWDNILATDIDDLQISNKNACITVNIHGRSSEVDRTYQGSSRSDNHRTMSLESQTYMRNLQ